MSEINYIFNEKELLEEIQSYIDQTYTQHYAQNKYQATDFIADAGHGEGFCVGNIFKYAQRYGKKDGKNRKDILKVIHYAIILLAIHDRESKQPDLQETNTTMQTLYSNLIQKT